MKHQRQLAYMPSPGAIAAAIAGAVGIARVLECEENKGVRTKPQWSGAWTTVATHNSRLNSESEKHEWTDDGEALVVRVLG